MAKAVGETYLEDVINPEVMADMVSAKVDKKIRMLPFAKVDTTLQGRPGSTVTVPKWSYIGNAADVAEGEEIPVRAMGASTEEYTIKKAGNGVSITDEAILSGLGNPVGQATTQLADSIYAKCDEDAKDAFYSAQTAVGFASALSYNNVVKGIDAFNEEVNSAKVLFIHPNQVTDLRLDSNFISADKYNQNVIMYGEIGMIANARVVPSKRIRFANGQWQDILVKTNNDTETEDDLPAITIYTKRDVNLETERITRERKTEITVDRMYVVALTNPTKVVILKCTDGASVAPLVINYNKSTYLYPLSGTNYSVPAIGYNFTDKASAISGVDYEINVAGIIPLIPATTKSGLGFDAAVTNIFASFIEIKTQGSDFDITKLKYTRHGGTLSAVTADDVWTYAGKTYLIVCMGVYDTDGAGTIGNKVSSSSNLNLIDVQYDNVTKVYKYTYTNGSLAV